MNRGATRTHTRRRWGAVAVVGVLCASLSGTVLASNKNKTKTNSSEASAAAGKVLRQERFVLYLAGERAGRLVAVDRVDAQGRLELVRESHLALRRGATEVRISSRLVTLLGPQLEPLRFTYQHDDGTGQMRMRGEVRAGQVHITTEAGGATTRKTVSLESGVLFASALEARSRRILRDGDHFEGRVLFEELGAVVPASYKVEASAQGFIVRTRIAEIDNIEQLDKQGRTRRIEIPALGGYAVPEGEAPPPALTTTVDVLERTTWKAPPDLPSAARLAAVTFRIDGTLPRGVPEDRRQRVLKRRKTSTVVRVQRQTRGPVAALDAATRVEFLAPTPYEPVSDPRIQAAAREATRGARSDADKVRQLTRFVYERINKKDLTRAYAPATETLELGVGDCTEHSVLFSALAKASGLPTRLVDGVIVADGRIGYHEWVEVYLEGEGWRPVDPTFGEPLAGPNRLKLAVGSSQPESLLRMGMAAAAALNGLKISVIAHES